MTAFSQRLSSTQVGKRGCEHSPAWKRYIRRHMRMRRPRAHVYSDDSCRAYPLLSILYAVFQARLSPACSAPAFGREVNRRGRRRSRRVVVVLAGAVDKGIGRLGLCVEHCCQAQRNVLAEGRVGEERTAATGDRKGDGRGSLGRHDV